VSRLTRPARRLLRPLRAALRDERDRVRLSRATGCPIPPRSLRARVHGSSDVHEFLAVGERCAADVAAAIDRSGLERDRLRVLDFGCGCGRVLRWLVRDPRLELHGTDVDADAVAWVRRRLPHVRAGVNERHPPLEAQAAAFDVVYAVSVLTHLDEDDAAQWLEEWRRIVRPGGIVVASVHGPDAFPLAPHHRDELRRRGFLFAADDRWRGTFPGWYQTAVHTSEYVRKQFGRWFEVVEHVDRGLNDHQDLVVLRRR
jgi:SAM-dependent methyltransferase